MSAPAGSTTFTLEAGRVAVWRADLESLPAGEEARALLASAEILRAETFRFERDRAAFIARRAWLRTLLGNYLERDPKGLEFATWGNGKPRLVDGALHFNASHSHGVALIAVTLDSEIGVDIEWRGGDWDVMEVAEHYFAPSEVAAFETLSASERRALFFRTWTCKEAYVKALASGLSLPTRSFEVPLSGPGGAITIGGAATGWRVRLLDLGQDYEGALAIASTSAEVVLRPWPPRAQ